MTVATEARADEIAADIHARMPWMAPATEAAWHAMRRCAQSGAPVLPELLVTDGASHFKSEAFRQVCADLGIATEIATNGKPETRGTVERVFRQLRAASCRDCPGGPSPTSSPRGIPTHGTALR